MAKAYYIAHWIERYEVTDQGRPATKPGDCLVRPLRYVRLKVCGFSQGPGYRSLQQAAGSSRRLEVAYAVFCKLLELSADQLRERRGWILTHQGNPATAADIAFYTGFTEKSVTTALEILSDSRVGWIRLLNLQEAVGTSSGLQEPTGSCPYTYTETETDTETETPALAGSCPFEEIAAAWNEAAKDSPLRPLLTPARLGDGRKAKLTARWKDPVFQERYREAFTVAAATPFMCGKGEKGWVVTFDWMVKNDTNYGRVLEGQFGSADDGRPPDTGSEAAKHLKGLKL